MEGQLREDIPQSDADYMNPQQQDFFRRRLTTWRDQLIDESHMSLQRIREGEHSGGDLIDRSVHDTNQVYDFITRKRNETMIQRINAALKRLENGTFGYCLESGEEIGLDRLMAYPVATLSVEAQEFIEKRGPKPVRSDMVM